MVSAPRRHRCAISTHKSSGRFSPAYLRSPFYHLKPEAIRQRSQADRKVLHQTDVPSRVAIPEALAEAVNPASRGGLPKPWAGLGILHVHGFRV